MRVLVVGNGGREHAMLHSLARSPEKPELVAYPGREGFDPPARVAAGGGGLSPVEILAAARREGADLTLIGPEAPLVEGVADLFAAEGMSLFGPSREAARLEGSKCFTKEVVAASGVPTARSVIVRSMEDVPGAIAALGLPAAVKADGLAAGKGVVIAGTGEEAAAAARAFLVGKTLGGAGDTLLFEEFLRGEELSVLALVRDEDFVLFPPSRDYKRIGEGGTGPNTGGMGAISPVPGIDGGFLEEIGDRVFRPVLRTMRERGAPYRGILYAGLMLTAEGPKLLEFNCRFGDPETQAVLERLEDDLLPRFAAVARGEWDPAPLRARDGAAACVVLASAGYPAKAEKGDPIEGLDHGPPEGVLHLHAGTARREGRWVTAGGRVLGVVARGASVEEALARAYEEADKVRFRGKQMRRDIGKPGVQG
ncbi:MAG: phosphoribosylamine--glycine ligase [Candidatus Eisenbacteria bacterium]